MLCLCTYRPMHTQTYHHSINPPSCYNGIKSTHYDVKLCMYAGEIYEEHTSIMCTTNNGYSCCIFNTNGWQCKDWSPCNVTGFKVFFPDISSYIILLLCDKQNLTYVDRNLVQSLVSCSNTCNLLLRSMYFCLADHCASQ